MARFLAYALSFAFISTGVVSWLTPYMLEWYATPAVDIGINCGPTAKWAMDRMLYTQLGGFGLGCVIGMMFWASRGRSEPPSPQITPQ